MSEVLLVEIEFNLRSWYLSEEGFIGKNYYAPYLADSLSFELGEIKGGFIGVRLGNLSIANRPDDKASPFSIFGGGYAVLLNNPSQKIPVQIYWQQKDISQSIFDGHMYLNSFDNEKFTFLLEDKVSDVDLLSEAVDINSDLVSVGSISIQGQGATALVTAPDHGLVTGDEVRVSSSVIGDFNTLEGTFLTNVPVTVLNENEFQYTLTGSANSGYMTSDQYSLERFTKKPQPFSFGKVVRQKDIIQTAERERDTVGELSGFEFANPDLEFTYDSSDKEKTLLLFDDGVLVGTNETPTSTSIAAQLNSQYGVKVEPQTGSSNSPGIVRNGDIFTITTVSSHGLVVGSTFKLSKVKDDSAENELADALNTSGPFHVVSRRRSATKFDAIIRVADEDASFADNSGDSSDPNYTGSFAAIITTPGEYFGVDRLPTATTIFSRAAAPNLAAYDASASPPGPTKTSSDGTLTSKDGTVMFGTPLVSGMSRNGRTLADFFVKIREMLGIASVDFSDAPNASTTNLELWETTQTKVLEFAGEISYAANHLFEIKNDVIRVIDRSIEKDDFVRINNWDIISAEYELPTPVKALRSKWTENVINKRTIPASLSTREESVMISNQESGEIVEIKPVTRNPEDLRVILEGIKKIINQTVIKLKVGNIRSNIKIGSRIKANREEDGVSIDMTVRTIGFNFSGLETELAGEGTVKVIEQDSIY